MFAHMTSPLQVPLNPEVPENLSHKCILYRALKPPYQCLHL